MIGQCLVEDFLEKGGTKTVGHVTIGTVTEEELAFGCHCCFDVLPTINVLLASVHNTNVALCVCVCVCER